MKLFAIRSLHPVDGVTQVLHSFSHKVDHDNADCKELVDHFGDTRPDFFYFHKDEHITVQLMRRLKQASPKTNFVMCYWDQRGQIPPVIASRKGLIDTLLINNEDPNQFRMYQDFGISKVFTFHHSAPPDEFQLFDLPITNDVFFGGNNFNPRKFPLSKFRYDIILRVRGLFDTVIYGNGWPFKTMKSVPRYQYARVLRTAKINLGINHYSVFRYYDRRLFECMASGRCHVTHYIPGMEKHFENGKHLMWFHTMKECLNIIQNLLKYPEKREMIAAAGRELILKNHTFDVRAAQLADILRSL